MIKNILTKLPREDLRGIKKALSLPVRDISQDSEVRDYLQKHRVYISLTSDPDRLKILPLMINILDTENVHEIHINLPRKYRNEISYKLEEIRNVEKSNSKVRVFRPPKDLGPVTKILPTLKRIKDPEAIIISIDDDIVYPYGLINEMIYQKIKYPDQIITGHGFTFGYYGKTSTRQGFNIKNRHTWWPQKSQHYPYVDIAEGFGSITYKKSLVDLNLLENLNSLSKLCKLSDDLTINYTLAQCNIRRRFINNKYAPNIYIHPLVIGEEKGLHVQTPPKSFWNYNVYKYVECLKNIKQYLK